MSIEEYWDELGKPKTIYDPQQIENFLNMFIKKTKGNLNLDTIHNHEFSDNIVRIERDGSLFRLYWKDYKKNVDNQKSGLATEHEIEEVIIYGGVTFIYYLMDIHKISIEISDNNGVYVIFHCNYLTQNRAEKYLKKIFDFENIENAESKETRKRIFFSDNNNYKHECVIDILPITNSILFQKRKLWRTSDSHKLLKRSTLFEIINPVYKNKKLFSELIDDNEDEIRSMINDLRYSLEGLIKFYFITEAVEKRLNESNTVHSNSLMKAMLMDEMDDDHTMNPLMKAIIMTFAHNTDDDHNMDDDHIMDSIIENILIKFSHTMLGDLKKDLKSMNITLDQSFINVLNKYSHYSGSFATKSILLECHEKYCDILKKLFDLSEYGINIEALMIHDEEKV